MSDSFRKVPLVSIVMPTRGRPAFVGRAIKSALNQSFGDFELVILDNSPGPVKEMIQDMSNSDPRIVFVDRGDIGVTEARKLGASISRGTLFALLDSDDYWDHDRLKRHLQVWNQGHIGLSWDRWAEVGQDALNVFPQPFREGLVPPPMVAAQLYWSNFIHASAGIVTTVFAKKLGFPLLEIMSSDWTLFMRAAEYYPAYFIGDCLTYKEIGSPERVSNVETKEFFARETSAIRNWALHHRPGLYGPEYAKRRIRRIISKVRRQPSTTHEPRVMKTLLAIHGEVFVDVGANRGQFSIPLSRNFKRVIAVEPNPTLAIQGRNIDVIRCAISDRSGEANLYLDKHPVNPNWTLDTILSTFTYRPGHDRHITQQIQGRKSIKVVTETLDRLLADIDRVDLLKIDVEGAEFLVLDGAKVSLSAKKIENIVIEIHDREKQKEVEDKLKGSDYEFRWLDRDHIFASLKKPRQRQEPSLK
jgi:FkbM family methyltransferase